MKELYKLVPVATSTAPDDDDCIDDQVAITEACDQVVPPKHKHKNDL